jgi:two-component system, NtrC family, sensor kinase
MLSLLLVSAGTWMLLGQPDLAPTSSPHGTLAPGIIFILVGVAINAVAIRLFARSTALRVERVTAQRDRLRRNLLRSAKLASLGELSADLAHDLDNALAALSADQNSIRRELERLELDAGARETLMRSIAEHHRIVARCAATTSKMVNLGRTKNTVAHAADILPVVDGVKEQLCRRARQRGIALSFAVGDHLPRVVLDLNELEIVLVNLVNNAIDAICGSGWINMQTWHTGGEVLLTVEDSGAGIAPEDLERVFQPFFTTKAVSQATGLGLAVSHEIVKGWGGSIEVQSAQDKGTVVTLHLPVHQPRPQEDRKISLPAGLRAPAEQIDSTTSPLA